MSYALYKFHKAILSLYGTELQRRQWLTSSYVHHIIHLRDNDLPEAVRGEFSELRQRLTRIRADGPTATLEQTVKAMDNAEINTIIDRIIAIYDAMQRCDQTAQQA
ncbi:MAG TPA: hypothetical protein VEC06_21310 [Paucimonas sp.]|nr:hypothetical protein [Paucimonas sp.]